jgi:hypothetical protein
MTEGGIAGWRKKEGETFTAGDVLLEIVRTPSTSPNHLYESVAMEICSRPWIFRRQERLDVSIRNQMGAMITEEEVAELISRKRIKQQ